MKKTLIATLVAGASLTLAVTANADTQMQRLYNPNSGEHFYTADVNEKTNLVSVGWSYEGIGWVAPDSGDPVYRLYNPNAGDHHYTKDINERDSLIVAGWSYEGVSWYSGGSVPLHRAYNPNAKAGAHNYTTNTSEQANLISVGWNSEGISWYGVAGGSPASVPVTSTPTKPAAGGQYYVSDGWSIAASGMVFVHKSSGTAYTRVQNPGNYNYVTWANQPRPDGTGNNSARFYDNDLNG